MSNAIEERKYVGPAAVEQLISNTKNALDEKQPRGDYLTQSALSNAITDTLAAAKESGEFDGADGNGIVSISIEEV